MVVTRTYECRNTWCTNFRVPIIVHARPLGCYWEFPGTAVVCACGYQVPIVAVDGKPLDAWVGRDFHYADPTVT